ncbi:sulfocyanin-like copper-binding protein [Sulfuracidifex tepidarius]|uniref:Sulfocyanin-like C-terminal domain-containing protein n=1 Tax=Sulfuracidifex tepidarius TaxID=1294262 RepID=A0A510DU56_9CREN|nr:sulfocyanin-like copper-binding protein [Sulfuracidifex tepidarius]BBG23731.1 hypothetical protein IC006_1022 [Sulfuracidifex tepidarius]BBG26485.1 hypothetical protein IC007_0996 [Sulfuracidifex tepidarius]
MNRNYVVPLVTLLLVLTASFFYLETSKQTSQSQESVTSTTSTTNVTTTHLPDGAKILPHKGHEVFLHLCVNPNVNGGVNINGTVNGMLKVYIPEGWTVNISLYDGSELPHNLNVVRNTTPVPNSVYIAHDGEILATVGGSPSTYDSSFVQPGEAAYTLWDSSPGVYWLACGFPGHAEMGMWAVMVVSNVSVPYSLEG